MNILIVLSVTTVLLVYCHISWQSVSLTLDLALQRALCLKQQSLATGLLQYGYYLLTKNHAELVAAASKTPARIVLYSGDWPLQDAVPVSASLERYHGKLELELVKAPKSAAVTNVRTWRVSSTISSTQGVMLDTHSVLLQIDSQRQLKVL